MPGVPERIRWAVGELAPRPRDHILEIGCGNGVAAELLLSSHPKVTVTAVDRSITAIAACQRRLAPFIEQGRAIVSRCELGTFSSPSRFDRALAINVNSFWLDAEKELAALSSVLVPGGRVALVFEPPSPKKIVAIGEACSRQLSEHGFVRVAVTRRGGFVAVTARCVR